MSVGDDAVLRAAVGVETFLRGRDYVRQGAVIRFQWPDGGPHIFGEVRGNGRRNYSSIAVVQRTKRGELREFRGTCTCPVGANCKHTVALVLAALPAADVPAEPVVPPAPSWERVLEDLVSSAAARTPSAEPAVALQFEYDLASLRLRPVLPGRNGGWVRQGVSWASLDYLPYGRAQIPEPVRRVLAEIGSMDPREVSRYYSTGSTAVDLAAFGSPRVWDLLAEARELGVPFVETGRPGDPVTLLREPAELRVDLARTSEALVLTPSLAAGTHVPDLGSVLLLGSPAHGLAWRVDGEVHLAGLTRVLDEQAVAFMQRGRLSVPRQDESRFFSRYYPVLRRQVTFSCTDGSLELPEPERPRLLLSVNHRDGHRVGLGWSWRYGTAAAQLGDLVRAEPLWPEPGVATVRDHDGEMRIVRAVEQVLEPFPALFESLHTVARLAAEAELSGIDAIRFDGVLPVLHGVEDLDIETTGIAVSYRESADAPRIEVNDAATDDLAADGDRDWFDLAVTVSVEGERVPFEQVFLALAAGHSHFVLPSGTYFALDRPEFREMAELIAEARGLQDAPPGVVRITRFQTSLWDDLERVGAISGQAAEWQRSARVLADVTEIADVPVPAQLQATLRDYQSSGFAWLVFLYEHGLGGILADEMGLGKTVQVIALMCHAKAAGAAPAPFLVVAPTSVVYNWASECARFAPHLRVRTVTETAARRGADLRAATADADIVITSYTLFRLEHEDYLALDWAGLFLDEAQFAKNRNSKNYACAKQLPAPFKLAITGTPMENNLAELWALLSITAPGLFPSPTSFESVYRRPIERGRDATLLARLRRRVRPLMLRRAKKDVLRELPDKQEQVIELALNPKHARVYRTHLQRERQKVLGLLDDLDGNRFEIFRSLTLLRQACLDAVLIDPAYAGVPSTKLDALMELLGEIVGEGHRTLVFSQFTRFLGAARDRLDTAGIAYCYLDGTTRDRAAVLAEFKGGTAPVFLISLKAGGFGLNLTEADYCVLLDPWWNPATEAQAIDRAHRIGQQNKVMVYRLVAKDTIEQKVMALKASKLALVDSVLADGDFGSGRLSADDIRGMLELE